MKSFCRLLIIVHFLSSIVFGVSELFTSKNTFLHSQWTTDNGLPQNSIRDLIQTKDGYIWVATFGGLTRFDGVKFTNFMPSNTPILKDTRFLSIFEDNQGILWVNAEYGNIYYYFEGQFYLYEINSKANLQRFVGRDKDGGVWIQSDKVLRKHFFENLTISETYSKEISIADQNGIFSQTSLIQNNELWYVSADFKLISTNLETGEVYKTEPLFENDRAEFLLNDIIEKPSPTDKTETNKGFWVITNKAVKRFVNNKLITIIKADDNSEIEATFIDKSNILFAVVGENIFKITNTSEIEKIKIPNLKSLIAECMSVDSEGNIWIGTNNNGIYQFQQNYIKTYGRVILDDLKPSFSVIEDNEKVWFGSFGLFSVKNNELKAEWETEGNDGKPSFVRSMTKANDGTIWFAANSSIYRIVDDKVEFVRELSFDISYKNISVLFIDRENNMWVGRPQGLQIVKGNEITKITTENGLINNWIQSIVQTRNGDIWIGTTKGASRYVNGEIVNFTAESQPPVADIRDIFEDADGTIWLGTYGDGIFRYKNNTFTQVKAKQGLPEDVASAIVLDDSDNFWFLGNLGVYTINRKMLNDFIDGQVTSFTASVLDIKDGMIVAEGNGIAQYSGLKAKDGTIWFTMVSGIIAISPNREKTLPPTVFVERVENQNNKFDLKSEINIPYNLSNIEIEYTGLSFKKPESLQFRTILEGFDKDWHFVGKRRVAYYSALPAGEYVFKVEALSSTGIWSETVATVKIKVITPFWQSWWFISLMVILFCSLMYLAHKIRLQRIEKAKLRQQYFSKQLINAHEDERKRIASDLHDGIGQNLIVISNWASIAAKNEEKQADNREIINQIKELAVTAIEETRAVSANLMPINLKRFGLTKTIKNTVDTLNKATQVEFLLDIDHIDNLLPEESELSLYRVTQEALNNIIKHSKATKAKVVIKETEQNIRLLIQDNGKGFYVKKFTEPELQHKGLGLNNMTERIHLIGGTISITSSRNSGTLIDISVSIPKK